MAMRENESVSAANFALAADTVLVRFATSRYVAPSEGLRLHITCELPRLTRDAIADPRYRAMLVVVENVFAIT